MKKYNGVFEYYRTEQFLVPDISSTVVVNSYWIKTGDEFMKSKKTGVWQYHVNKSVAERISTELPGTEVQYLSVCYIPKNPKKVEDNE